MNTSDIDVVKAIREVASMMSKNKRMLWKEAMKCQKMK